MEGLLMFSLAIVIIFFIALIACFVFYFIGLWKMFKKCGKQGWESIVPIYNTWILVEIADLKAYWFFICLAPSLGTVITDNTFLSLIFAVIGMIGNIAIIYNISKKFNKNTTWFVLSIFFGGITIPLLGYSCKENYHSEIKVEPNGCFESVFKN